MSADSFFDGRVVLHSGDCLDVLKTLEPNSIDSIVSDPPYGLEFMGKGWDGSDGFRRSLNSADAGRNSVHGRTSKRAPEYRTAGAGVTSKPGIGRRDTEWVSNQGWNQFRCETCSALIGHGGSPCRCENPKPVRADNRWPLFQEFMFAVAVECLRVLKPGGHFVAFGGTRTYHRMACAMEDAGFEIRDSLQWLYGSGFPKSHDVSKAIDRAAGAEREVIRERYTARRIKPGATVVREGEYGKQDVTFTATDTAPAPDEAAQWQGWGTALKPACEPIVLARKPLIGTVAENVLTHGVGALNIDGCRVATDGETFHAPQSNPENRTGVVGIAMQATGGADRNHAAQRASIERTATLGRWPANIIHDGSDEVVGAFPDAPGQQRSTGPEFDRNANVYGKFAGVTPADPRGDSGSAARFFYTAKADADDRIGSKHPTVKPVDLMQWLVRLVTPKGGLVLDPFAGTGTTGEAAWREGMRAVLIEREPEYQDDIRRRMALCLAGPDERARESIKARMKDRPVDAGPLFTVTP